MPPVDELRPAPARTALPGVAVVLLLAGAAAVWTVWQAQGMWTASGTLGLGALGFAVMWAVMMAAMMLPSMAPVAALYLRSLDHARARRGVAFVGGYLVVWTASALGAYGLALGADAVVAHGDPAPRLFAATLLGLGAVYHVTAVHGRLLGHCRSPFGLVLHYSGYRGRLRDLRAGLHHGLTCLGCCWPLMALLFVFGVMNVAAMVAIGAVVATEKLWRRGEGFARSVGWAAAVLAAAVLVVPDLAVGLTHGPM